MRTLAVHVERPAPGRGGVRAAVLWPVMASALDVCNSLRMTTRAGMVFLRVHCVLLWPAPMEIAVTTGVVARTVAVFAQFLRGSCAVPNIHRHFS
jgi:hypothetical protein